MKKRLLVSHIVSSCLLGAYANADTTTLRVASFNVSMEAGNYQQPADSSVNADGLRQALSTAQHPQIRNIAEIIQTVRPDILLLNEFDYIADPKQGLERFLKAYLKVAQNQQQAIDYPYYYLAPVNTGVATPLPAQNTRLSHYGYGKFAGQYGMAVLSKYPIELAEVRSFRHFLWQDMPNNLMPVDDKGNSWYSQDERKIMRLSSKSHWDLPIQVGATTLHLLASHPTPPVFDGPEDRNGRRNHDEIRFWRDYIDAKPDSYHYDDRGGKGGLAGGAAFIIAGDLNASPVEGSAHPSAISQLLEHPKLAPDPVPQSQGGRDNKPDNPNSASHTAFWGMRADYVLPSKQLKVQASGVFWPTQTEPNQHLVKDRKASSDHRLVWVDIQLPEGKKATQ